MQRIMLGLVCFSVFFMSFAHAEEAVQEKLKTYIASGCVVKLRQFPDSAGYRVTLTRYCDELLPDLLSDVYFSKLESASSYFEIEARNREGTEVSSGFSYANSLKKTQASSEDGGSIWEAKHEWNEEWETKYSEWVANEVGEDFFSVHGIATDCADAAYGLRWIFSRMHGLPAMATIDRTVKMTERTAKEAWRELPVAEQWHQDQRFRAALEYLMKMTYTHTLELDTYPVLISTEYLVPGAIHLSLYGESGHAMIVKRVDPSVAPYIFLISSTVPRSVRELSPSGFWSATLIKEGEGFRRFAWPHLSKKSDTPGYSNQQYELSFLRGHMSFAQAVLSRFGVQFNIEARMNDGVTSLRAALGERLALVQAAQEKCAPGTEGGACQEGTRAYENLSTFSRDKRLRELILQLELLYSECRFRLLKGCEETWNRELASNVVLSDRSVMRLKDLVPVWSLGLYQSDPNVSEHARWGFDTEALLKQIAGRIKYLTEKREALIAKHEASGRPCATRPESCVPGSELFSRWTTAAVDIELWRLSTVFHRHEALRQALEHDTALAEALVSSGNLSSDPRTHYQNHKSFIELTHELEQKPVVPANIKARRAFWVDQDIAFVETRDVSFLRNQKSGKKLGKVEVPSSHYSYSPCLWIAEPKQKKSSEVFIELYDCTQGFLRRGVLDLGMIEEFLREKILESRISGAIGADENHWYLEISGRVVRAHVPMGILRVKKATEQPLEFLSYESMESAAFSWMHSSENSELRFHTVPGSVGVIALYSDGERPLYSGVVDPWGSLALRRNHWSPRTALTDGYRLMGLQD